MIDLRAAALIAVCAGVTMLLRFLPFLVFGGKKEVPGYITYLSGVLPYAIMGMLVVYCLKNMNLFAGTHGDPGNSGVCCCCRTPCLETEYAAQHRGWDSVLYVSGPGGILNDRILLVR